MSTALNKTGKHIVYSVCNWGYKNPWEWAPKIANSWRTTGDIGAKWTSVLQILDANRELYKYSSAGAWNDPDMLEVGVVRDNDQLTRQEARSHFSLWTMLNSPLLLGNDLRKISQPEYKWVVDIIANKDAISVNQDKGAKQARLTTEVKRGTINTDGGCDSSSCVRTETWTRPLSGGSANFAALLLNRAGVNAGDIKFNKEKITLTWTELGVSSNTKLRIKDIWNQKELGIFTTQYQSDEIGQHDVAYLLLTIV
jgi:alpha-galactosidase